MQLNCFVYFMHDFFPSHNKFCLLLLSFSIFTHSEPGSGCLRSYVFIGQPNPQELGGEPGPAWPQQPAGILHPLLLPPSNRGTCITPSRWVTSPVICAVCIWEAEREPFTGPLAVIWMGTWLLTSPFLFYPSISMCSWHTVLRDADAVRHHIESNRPPEQPPPVPLQEHQQLQPGPGQHSNYSWWRGAEDHREQGELQLSIWNVLFSLELYNYCCNEFWKTFKVILKESWKQLNIL